MNINDTARLPGKLSWKFPDVPFSRVAGFWLRLEMIPRNFNPYFNILIYNSKYNFVRTYTI